MSAYDPLPTFRPIDRHQSRAAPKALLAPVLLSHVVKGAEPTKGACSRWSWREAGPAAIKARTAQPARLLEYSLVAL